MKILINMSNVAIGGGLTRNFNLLYCLGQLELDHEFLVLAPKNVGYNDFENKKVKIKYVPKLLIKRTFRFILDYYWIKKIINGYKPHAILNMVNLCLPYKLKQAAILADPFSPISDFSYLNLSFKEKAIRKLRNRVFKNRLNYCTIGLTQTLSMKKKLIEKYSLKKNIYVIYNSYSILPTNKNFITFEKQNNMIYLLCFTRYYEHKNIEILLKVAEEIQTRKSNFRIIITISKNQGNRAKHFLNRLNELNYNNIIQNIGEIHYKQIPHLYEISDGLLLPTLLESYSSTYADAMYYKKPIFTSNLDFSREICGDEAFYFDPLNHYSIYQTIQEAYSNPEKIRRVTEKAYSQVKNSPNWFEISKNIVNVTEKI